MDAAQPGKILFVTGLYCAGKTTLIGEALRRIPELSYIPTFTTREPRPAERRDGTHEYIFVDQAEYDLLHQTPGWDHTELRGVSYGSDAGAVSRGASLGQAYIVVKTMNENQLSDARTAFGGQTTLLFLNTDFETCRQRVIAPGSGRSAKYLTDPTQTTEQMALIRSLADYVYNPIGPLESDKTAFSEFVRGILASG